MAVDAWSLQVETYLAQVQLRHRPAFEALYQHTSSRLFGLVCKIVTDREIAADVLQEAFLKVWQSADKYRSGLGGAWAWICQLTRNCALDRVRQSQRSPLSQGVDDEVLSELVGDESEYWAGEKDLSRCLQKIREEPRKAIVLAYIHGLSHSELVVQLDTPLGTLKSWIRRGLKELNVCLEA